MKKMIIFDPAMCCSTGVCGPSVNKELLRVATVLNTLKNKGILVERYNLTNNPQIFVTNRVINQILNTKGVEALPVIMVDGVVVKAGSYPTNEEFCKLLGIPSDTLKLTIKKASVKKSAKSCGCKGGCC
ncbi:arsenite efflux transporter metallochaperone ArsD [Clostridium saccharobutylicum]|uniref:Arsenical resistance operon trans-acting repressor ArsD n=1 Tax=Clostridium saccharobutylicum DSM 13864 TaxID=1345695 RepID=U5MQ70_CLOSA|nr:arsenite efflux transporter metallochaperone ArsD [Clostridium saccharobutylicum]AGX42668.1 arsenical resistance operon trans-acting repressor ArsD [Clostridium saccharobutylicum DSM 13864]AQR89958.1 arsenical resistance operon trans-acting repressor ArsD [Clostridium saccharobutylicum]AQR99863.1 arsenical resistance operon trans-acting repressor ArsD [Clostridium saccharobutylicum]AQS09591.1 arsenical resistance operon trans-acting repressor ArsD [Clostridium saccharobutylicum]AQS13847.1 a